MIAIYPVVDETRDVYSKQVFQWAYGEFMRTDWVTNGFPFGSIVENMTDLALRYWPNTPRKKLEHDVQWAYAESIGGGCEEEVL